MKRNWYIACTKQQKEQSVIAMLNKKNIENYCPYTSQERVVGASKFLEQKPLFNSLIFVCVTESELYALKDIKNITSTVYWMAKPAIINNDEIEAIKMVADNYLNITFKKYNINHQESICIVEDKVNNLIKSVWTIQSVGLTVTLPSLGYTLVAKRPKELEEIAEHYNQDNFFNTSQIAKKLYPLFLLGL